MPKPPPQTLPELDAMMTLSEAFERAARDDPALDGARLEEVIRLVPGKHALIGGHLGAQAAIFRFHIEEGEARARRDWAELTRAAVHMGGGDLRVNQPLHHLPDLGLVVVERIFATPLMQHIWQAEHERRCDYLGPAAAWLRKYTAPSEERASARLEGWFARARRGMERQPYEMLRPVEAALMEEITRIAPPFEGTPWRWAICHGDFHPNNLLVAGARVTGIDIGGSSMLPIYKDMARFLAHMARRGLNPSRTRHLGVDRAGFAAFAETFALNATEREIWLPFMIGIEALIRVESPALSRARIRWSKAFYEELLEGLRDIRP